MRTILRGAIAIALLICIALPAFGQDTKKAPKKAVAKKEAKKEMTGPAKEPHPNGKYGGTLRGLLRENWPSLSPHEESTIGAVWPASPMFNNLVLYDPYVATESSDRVIGELAQSWAWSEGTKKLTFKLRRGVKWHDGQPFTAKDVKFTFDVARGAAEKRFRLNPRKGWWDNIQDITTSGDYEVSFLLKRPQPSLIAFLANGYAPVYPSHIDPQEQRTKPVGTGPFKFKEAKPDELLVLEKNPDYFVKGRPYLDDIVFTVIKSTPSQVAAMQAKQLDVYFPGQGSPSARDQWKVGAPDLIVKEVAAGVTDNILMNATKPPFDNSKLRAAVNLSLDRAALIKSVHQGAAIPGGANLVPPYGKWGLERQDLVKMPGYGDPEKNKAEARKILAELGYGSGNPLKVTVSTRAIQIYVDVAVWMIDQLKQVGIEGTLEQVETGVWHPKVTRKEYTIALNLTGVAVDDPDANYFENYTCTSARNYSGYCNKELEALMAKASEETNPTKRLAMVRDIDRRLQLDGARPILDHRMDFMSYWPYVKNLVPHHNIYNYGRLQNVWLDK